MRLILFFLFISSFSLSATEYLIYLDNSRSKKVLATISNLESLIDTANDQNKMIFILGNQNNDQGKINYDSYELSKDQLLDEIEDYVMDQKNIQNNREISEALKNEIVKLNVFDDVDNFKYALKNNISVNLFFNSSNFVVNKIYSKVIKKLLHQYNLINMNGIHPMCKINIFLELSENSDIYLETINEINSYDKNINIYTY